MPAYPVEGIAGGFTTDTAYKVKAFYAAESDAKFSIENGLRYDQAKLRIARNEAVAAAFAELRKDPQLNALSDKALREAILRVPKWNFYLSNVDTDPDTAFAALQMEYYRLRLLAQGIDPKARPPSFERMLGEVGANSLYHVTTTENSLDVLAKGKLASFSETKKTGLFERNYGAAAKPDPSLVYLEALSDRLKTLLADPVARADKYQKQLKNIGASFVPSDVDEVALEYGTSLLDELKWSHMNTYWMYGRHDSEYSIDPSYMMAGYFNLVRGKTGILDPFRKYRNEFLLKEPVGNSYLKAIHVHPSRIEAFRAQMKEKGLPQSLIDLVR